MLEEAYALGEQDAIDYAIKLAEKAGFGEEMKQRYRTAKDKVVGAAKKSYGYVKAHPKSFGGGAAAAAAAGGGYAAYKHSKGKKKR